MATRNRACTQTANWIHTGLHTASSSNSTFLLPLLQVVSISGQPWRAYPKFPDPEPWSAGGASQLWDHLCGTVFLLLYRDQRWHCTLSRDNWSPICSTSDVLTNRRNIHHCLVVLWHFRDSGARYKTADLHTYTFMWEKLSQLTVIEMNISQKKITSTFVVTCFASFTFAKLPLPIVFKIW